MTGRRKRIGPLDTIGSVIKENATVYKEFRRGRLDGSTASRLSQILMNHRGLLELEVLERRLSLMEEHVKLNDFSPAPLLEAE